MAGITNLTVTEGNGTHNVGANLTINVTFDGAVVVNDVGGTPSLTLEGISLGGLTTGDTLIA